MTASARSIELAEAAVVAAADKLATDIVDPRRQRAAGDHRLLRAGVGAQRPAGARGRRRDRGAAARARRQAGAPRGRARRPLGAARLRRRSSCTCSTARSGPTTRSSGSGRTARRCPLPAEALPPAALGGRRVGAMSNRVRRVVLLRHGRTEWNATGRFQGQLDSPLDGHRSGAGGAPPAVAIVPMRAGRDRLLGSVSHGRHGGGGVRRGGPAGVAGPAAA